MSTPQDPFRPPPEGGDGRPADGGAGGWTAPPGWGPPAQGGGQQAGWQPPPGWGQQGQGPPPASGQQPAWSPPGGRPPFGTAPGGPPRNGVGTAALVLGLLSVPAAITIVGGLALGLAGVLLGVAGRRRARQGGATNGGAATAGLVLGTLGLLATAAAVAVWVTVLRSDTGRDLVDCVQSAADQAAVERCQREFEDRLVDQG